MFPSLLIYVQNSCCFSRILTDADCLYSGVFKQFAGFNTAFCTLVEDVVVGECANIETGILDGIDCGGLPL